MRRIAQGFQNMHWIRANFSKYCGRVLHFFNLQLVFSTYARTAPIETGRIWDKADQGTPRTRGWTPRCLSQGTRFYLLLRRDSKLDDECAHVYIGMRVSHLNAKHAFEFENSFECDTLFVFNVVTHFAMRFEVHLVRQHQMRVSYLLRR